MHPLISRFLSVDAALATLEKTDELDADEAALVQAARDDAAARAAVLTAKGRKIVPTEAQQALILLATRAATARLEGDERFAAAVRTARQALMAEGATPSEAHLLVEQAVLEEAFGYAEDPAVFDAGFLLETLASFPVLAAITADVVDGWLEDFAGKDKDQRVLRLSVAEAVLEAAFGDGPQPVSPEHVDDALDAIGAAVATSELERAAEALIAFLAFLQEKKVIGAERFARLKHVAASAARGDAGPAGDDEEDEDDDEDDEA